MMEHPVLSSSQIFIPDSWVMEKWVSLFTYDTAVVSFRNVVFL